jgi:hypothetical protein
MISFMPPKILNPTRQPWHAGAGKGPRDDGTTDHGTGGGGRGEGLKAKG